MKRTTRRNIGAWPNMRDDTLAQIAGELIRARKKHPNQAAFLVLAESYLRETQRTFAEFEEAKIANRKGPPAAQLWALGATVAAMAIRIMEEGDVAFSYQGNALRVTTVQEND